MGTNPKPLVLPCFSRQTSAQQGTQQCSQQDRGDEKPWKRHAESWPKGRRRLLSVFVYLLQYTYVLCTYIWSYAYICVCLPLSLLIYLSIYLSICLSVCLSVYLILSYLLLSYLSIYPSIHLSNQWEFQGPNGSGGTCHIKAIFLAGISPYIALTYTVGTSNLGTWNGHWINFKCLELTRWIGIYKYMNSTTCVEARLSRDIVECCC